MNSTASRITRFVAAITFAFVLLGLGVDLAGALTVDSGPARSPEEEKAACTGFGGTWTTEHNGSVGVCTYPNGEQERCRFKTTGRCSIRWNERESQPSGTKTNNNATSTSVTELSEGGAAGGTVKNSSASKASNSDTSTIDERP